jgi:hypothetical protein
MLYPILMILLGLVSLILFVNYKHNADLSSAQKINKYKALIAGIMFIIIGLILLFW